MSRPGPDQNRPQERPDRTGIDPRGPRFGAGITAVLLLVVIALGLPGAGVSTGRGGPALILFSFVAALFAWGAFAGVARHPYGWLFKHIVRRRLSPPAQLEDPRPPTFSQGVGLVVAVVGIGLHLLGVPFALVLFASLAFVAAFLNAVFDYCLGCQLYLVLVRMGAIRQHPGRRSEGD
ncbi:MAG: DUF4395 domain-containing protein [Microbacteriaceae bacterium]